MLWWSFPVCNWWERAVCHLLPPLFFLFKPPTSSPPPDLAALFVLTSKDHPVCWRSPEDTSTRNTLSPATSHPGKTAAAALPRPSLAGWIKAVLQRGSERGQRLAQRVCAPPCRTADRRDTTLLSQLWLYTTHRFSFLCFSLVCSTDIGQLCPTAMPLSLML